MKIVLVFSLFFIYNSLFGDILTLKNGQVFDGNFIIQKDGKVFFKSAGTTKEYPLAVIKKLDVGYGVASFCYKLNGDMFKENCDSTIHLLDSKKLIVAKGEGNLEKEEILTANINSVTVKRAGNAKIISIFSKGLELRVTQKSKIVKGSVLDIQAEKGILKLKSKEGEVSLKEEEISEVFWENNAKFDFSWIRFAIPGVGQFSESKLKGSLLFGLFLGLGVAIPAEYSAANKSLQNNVTYLPVGNTVLVLNGFGNSSEFSQHQTQMNVAIGGMVLLYAYNFWDNWRNTPQDKKEGTSFHIDITPARIISPMNAKPDPLQRTNIELKFTYTF